MKYFYRFSIITFLFYSCKKDNSTSSLNGNYYSYFPLDKGGWIIYNVDSIAHLEDDDFTNQPDTSISIHQFKIKEVVGTSFIDGQGNMAYHITRYKQLNDTLPWEFNSEWVATMTANSAQRVEDNVRYIKLAFPINLRITWNGNAYNFLEEEEYSYTEIHQPLSLSTYNFDSALTVLQLDDDNLLHKIYKEEKYANHVGMVYKQKDSLNINGILQVTNGFEYSETIQSYGR